jgi:hypothetical protein
MNNDPIINKILEEIIHLQDLLLQLTTLPYVALNITPLYAGPPPPATN